MMRRICEKDIYNLKCIRDIVDIKEIEGGYSGSKTFYVKTTEKEYFVKFRSWKTPHIAQNFELFGKYMNTAKLVEQGYYHGIQYYVAEYVIAENIGAINLDIQTAHRYGNVIADEQYSLSIEKKPNIIDKVKAYLHITREIDKIYKMFLRLYDKVRDTLPINIVDMYDGVRDIIRGKKRELLHSFRDYNIYFMHNDLRMNNFLIRDDKVYTIDFEESKYEYVSFIIRTYCYDILNNTNSNITYNFIQPLMQKLNVDSFANFKTQMLAIYLRVIAKEFVFRHGDISVLERYADINKEYVYNIDKLLEKFEFGEKGGI